MSTSLRRSWRRKQTPSPGPAAALALAGALWFAQALGADSHAAASPGVGVAFDLQRFINREIQAGNRRIVVLPGRYRVTPRDRQHLVLRGLSDVEIVADGVEMICTETTRALTLMHCTNVTVRGLTIDYDPLPFTQGRITGFADEKQVHEIELFPGYPGAAAARNFKYEIFRPDTRILRTDDRYPTKIEVAGPQRLRVHLPGGRPRDPEQVGDLIVIGAEEAPHGSAAHAVELSHCQQVRLENLTVFASNCFGFLETDCDGTTYYRCRIDRRSAEDEFMVRADPRLRSLNADAFHSKRARKGPTYVECQARFMGDDAVNINGDYHLVMSSRGKELRVLAKHTLDVQPGDRVELVSYDGQRLPDATAVAVQSDGTIRDEERTFVARQRMDSGLKTSRDALNRAYLVTLDREVRLPMGSVICAANHVGNGFVVKDCVFGSNRSRGILIKASHGQVSGNQLDGSRMAAILVAPEYWWLEAGSSSDLRITGNTITGCGGISILVEALGGNGSIAPAGAHRDITITDNTVKDAAMPGILVTSTTGLRLADNTLVLRTNSGPLPGLLRQAGLSVLQPVVEIHCERIAAGP